MIAGMALMAFLCIYLGLNPGHLYKNLPHGDVLAESLVLLHLHKELR